jgi:hypothetical protein
MSAHAREQLNDRERLLAEFDLVIEQDVATLLGIDVKTLRNRPLAKQPKFSKVGRDRLYHKQALKAFLEATTRNDGSPPLRRTIKPPKLTKAKSQRRKREEGERRAGA